MESPMQIQLSERARAIVDAQVASGAFDSPRDVVEQAIGLLAIHGPGPLVCVDPQTGEPLSAPDLAAFIQEGLDDEAAGRVEAMDVEDIIRQGREQLESGTVAP
jgi:hypothetical protein